MKSRIILLTFMSSLTSKMVYAQSNSVYEEKVPDIEIKCSPSYKSLRNTEQDKYIKEQNKFRANSFKKFYK